MYLFLYLSCFLSVFDGECHFLNCRGTGTKEESTACKYSCCYYWVWHDGWQISFFLVTWQRNSQEVQLLLNNLRWWEHRLSTEPEEHDKVCDTGNLLPHQKPTVRETDGHLWWKTPSTDSKLWRQILRLQPHSHFLCTCVCRRTVFRQITRGTILTTDKSTSLFALFSMLLNWLQSVPSLPSST